MRFTFLIFLLLNCANVVAKENLIPLKYNLDLIQKGFSSPVIELTINGTKGFFLLDSGASVTVVSSWFASKARIDTEESSTIHDSSGSSNATEIAQVRLIIEDEFKKEIIFEKQVAMIINLPNIFQESKIAGILSPQQLITKDESLLLALDKPLLVIGSSIANLKTEGERYSDLKVIYSSGPQGTTISLYALNSILETKSTTFLIDTGAQDIAIGSETEIGKFLLPKTIETTEQVTGVNGMPQNVRIFPRARLNLLGTTDEISLRIHPISKGMPADGMVGMRFLKKCSLILSHKSGQIKCL